MMNAQYIKPDCFSISNDASRHGLNFGRLVPHDQVQFEMMHFWM